MTALACTLVSGTYHIGAAALANSLHRLGYRGVFTVFHRDVQLGYRSNFADEPLSELNRSRES